MNKLIVLQLLLISLFSFGEIEIRDTTTFFDTQNKSTQSKKTANTLSILEETEESENLHSRKLDGPLCKVDSNELLFLKGSELLLPVVPVLSLSSKKYSPTLPRSPPLS